MAKLQFGSTVSPKGFTSFSTASFNEAPPAKIIRELLQNSLDAAAEGSEPEAKVRFQVDPIDSRNVPDLKGYNSAFEKARAYWTQGGRKLTDAAQEVVNRIESGLDAIHNGRAKLLSVMDNGIGLDAKRMNALLGDGAGEKQDNMSGSYGVGHLAPIALSDIRYMLYGGITQDGSRITCGKAVLASHPGKKQLNDGEGYLIKSFRDGLDGDLYEFLEKQHPRVVAKRLNEISKEWGHGSAVMMLAFNSFRSEETPLWDIVSKVAAYNFTAAIHRRKLVIEVREDGKAQRLDAKSLPGILEQDKDRTRASRAGSPFAGLRPSGQNAYSALKALDDGDTQRVKVNGGYARINLHLSSPNGYPRIDLFRNGMRITDDIPELRRGDFVSREPFHAVIEVDAENSGELHRLIRKAEGPMHDSLSLNLLSSQERDSLLQELAKIKEWINQQVPEAGNEEYTVDDMLLVNTDDGVQGRESFSFWGTPTPVSRRRSTQLMVDPAPTDDPPEPDPGLVPDSVPPPSPRSQPERERLSRPLPFRSAVVPDGIGRLIGSIRSSSNFPETRLMLRVDENVDSTCDRIWQDEDVSVKSFHITLADGQGPSPESEIIDNGRFVKIHEIAADTDYEVRVEYNAPPELASVVDRPVLRLELHRPPPKPHAHQTPNGEENAQNADGN